MKYASELISPRPRPKRRNGGRPRSALIEIYKTEANQKKSEDSKTRALVLAQKVTQNSQGDWAERAQKLIFYIQQGVPTWGNAGN
jgi:hypothetical protein